LAAAFSFTLAAMAVPPSWAAACGCGGLADSERAPLRFAGRFALLLRRVAIVVVSSVLVCSAA
jgi:hypothetical protein